jgi:phosphoheptose isomerase
MNVEFNKVCGMLKDAYTNSKEVYVCGNGTSLLLSDMFASLHTKLIIKFSPKIQSLSSSSLITAIANDVHFDDIFSFQISKKGRPDEVLIVISSSGNSMNLYKALLEAKKQKMKTIALVGGSGGACGQISDVVLHIKENNSSFVEQAHQKLIYNILEKINE